MAVSSNSRILSPQGRSASFSEMKTAFNDYIPAFVTPEILSGVSTVFFKCCGMGSALAGIELMSSKKILRIHTAWGVFAGGVLLGGLIAFRGENIGLLV